MSTHAILEKTGGEAALPLDDSFIHLQYSRGFAAFEPFRYSAGQPPAAGTTSLLWPLLLVPAHWLGLWPSGVIWVAWILGWVSLGALARETRLAASGLMQPPVATAAGAMVLAFAGFTWCASSGMEIVPFAFLLMRSARRAAEWAEGTRSNRRLVELAVLALATALMRPEGSLAALAIAVVLAVQRSGLSRKRAFGTAAFAALCPLLPVLAARLVTGATSTTAEAKWLPLNPYYDGSRLLAKMLDNLGLLFSTLLNGEIWSAIFLPTGSAPFFWVALPALLLAGWRHERRARALLLTAVGLGLFIPASYDSFLWNRLRYLWPFITPWFVGLAAGADLCGAWLSRQSAKLDSARTLLAGGMVGALLGHVPFAIEDLATSADAIRRQQVALGKWARETLPGDARIGVNDTGAIAYYSLRRVFDVVGLTTPGEAPHWVAGPGSRFEHYERLARESLPSHFIVYPEWFALDPLFGKKLTERRVDASILGGAVMAAFVADYSTLETGRLPRSFPVAREMLLDELDTADLVSERAHEYALLNALQSENRIVRHPTQPWVDGARTERTEERFSLKLAAGARLLARLGSNSGTRLDVSIDGRPTGTVELSAGTWQELLLPVGRDVPEGRAAVVVEARDGRFSSLHYWSIRPESALGKFERKFEREFERKPEKALTARGEVARLSKLVAPLRRPH